MLRAGIGKGKVPIFINSVVWNDDRPVPRSVYFQDPPPLTTGMPLALISLAAERRCGSNITISISRRKRPSNVPSMQNVTPFSGFCPLSSSIEFTR